MPPLIAIVGPTSSGKTDLSISLAHAFKRHNIIAEIVSADSRQVYKGLDLLSGKISKKEMQGVTHHMLDVADPKRTYSVAMYKKKAESIIEKIHARGHLPILVGGSGLYIDAIVYGTIFPSVPVHSSLRKKLAHHTAQQLYSQLKKLDPLRAKTIDAHNKVRLIRAIEIATALGKVPPVQQVKRYATLCITVDMPDEVLKKRIRTRLLSRIQKGMIKEASRLHKNGVSWKRLEDLGLECRYVSLYLQKRITKDEMLVQLESGIWHYAKRQRTWFRKEKL